MPRSDDGGRVPPGKRTAHGMPAAIRGCLFDLDGVLTKTAILHQAAWKAMFDEYLSTRPSAGGEQVRAFTAADYATYVDGRPRADGVRAFLTARGIELPEGQVDDPSGLPTVQGLSARKHDLMIDLVRDQGVEPYEGSVRFVTAVRRAGLRTAVVSASTNCADVLAAAGIADLFDEHVDGQVAERLALKGKPSPDTFLCAARLLDLEPAQCAVFEDALAGVAAGRAGKFGLVVGVDHLRQADALRKNGADTVVADLSDLLER